MHSESRRFLSIIIIETLMFIFFGILASFTIATHISQVIGLSFQVYSYLAILMSIVPIFFSLTYAKYLLDDTVTKDTNALLVIFIVSLVVGTLGLISNSSATDQLFYAPNAIYMLNHPDEPMSFDVHFFESGENCNTESLSWGTSNPYEYTRAVLAGLLNLNYLTVHYLITSFVVSILITLAIYLAINHFSNNTLTAAISTLFTIGFLLLLGETQRAIGGFAITNSFSGKTLLIAVGIPLFISTTINYFHYYSRYYWVMLLIVSTALIGATSTTIFLLPALATVLAISHYFISNEPKKFLRRTIFYGFSFGYLIIYAVFLATSMSGDFGLDSPVNVGYPASFLGHLYLIVNPGLSITLVVFIISTILAICFTRRRFKILLTAWIVSSIILFLNPWVASLLMRYITSSNVYWRLFFIFPFPLTIGIVAAILVERASRTHKIFQIAGSFVVALILISPHFVSNSSSVLNTTEIRIPPTFHKLPIESFGFVNQIVSTIPDGSMLTPRELSGIIPMVSSKHPQVVIKSKEVTLWLGECGKDDLAELRLASAAFVGGDIDSLSYFQEYLEVEGKTLTSIVLARRVLTPTSVKGDLLKYMFVNSKQIGPYNVFWK